MSLIELTRQHLDARRLAARRTYAELIHRAHEPREDDPAAMADVMQLLGIDFRDAAHDVDAVAQQRRLEEHAARQAEAAEAAQARHAAAVEAEKAAEADFRDHGRQRPDDPFRLKSQAAYGEALRAMEVARDQARNARIAATEAHDAAVKHRNAHARVFNP